MFRQLGIRFNTRTIMVFIKGLCLCIFILPNVFGERTPAAVSSYISAIGKVLPGPIPTNSFQITGNVTLNQCAAECSLQYHMNQFQCYAFEYVPTTRMCILTNITTLSLKGGYLGLINNPNMNYFERSKGRYLYLFQPFNNHVLQDETTYFALFENITVERCAKFCLLETRDTCMSFSYSQQKHVCGLSNKFYTENNGQKMITSLDYNHYQYFSSWPCNATIPWNYSPGAIASPYYPYASVKDINCHVTIEAPIGKQIDLVVSTLFTQRDICQDQNGGITVRDGNNPTAGVMSTLCSSKHSTDRRFQSSSGYLYVHFHTGSVAMAFKAVFDYIDVDPCAKSPCQHNSTCVREDGAAVCICVQGYTGRLCDVNIDDCTSSPCMMGGRCRDMVNGYMCECPNILGGERCDKFIGLCYTDPCKNGGICSPRGTDHYICSCSHGWSGTNCTRVVYDPCRSSPCRNGAECVSDVDKQTLSCVCKQGFSGTFCETNIDDCVSSPCQHNIPCTDLVNNYKCACPAFLAGKNCELFVGRCSKRPCMNGKCRPTGRNNYTCECDPAYTGEHCDTLFINYCLPNPCTHGACANFADGPSCTCEVGYTGFLCDQKIDYCDGVSCAHGDCDSIDDDFRCRCIPGYEGRFCNESINHCVGVDCKGGFCINTITSHFCVCKNGVTGLDCEHDANTCAQSRCIHGTCTKHAGKSLCVCTADYTGALCDAPIDYCIDNPCVHGVCSTVHGGFICSCDDNYAGVTCNTIIDHCKTNKCVNGFCQNLETSFMCVCASGYHGELCQFNPNKTETTSATSTPGTSTSIRITGTRFLDFVSFLTTSPPGTINCSSSVCAHGICVPELPNECLCMSGFSGKRCDKFDGCSSYSPCNNGQCIDTPDGGFLCACSSGFEGETCDTKVSDPCAQMPCQNEGSCTLLVSNKTDLYSCMCKPGFHGDLCERSNACQSKPCVYGDCVPNGMSFRCEIQPLIGKGNVSFQGLPFWFGMYV